MNRAQMSEAIRCAIEKCGLEVISDDKRLKSILSDFLPGVEYKKERIALVSALSASDWHVLVEAQNQDDSERSRAIKIVKSQLQDFLGWTEERSALVAESYSIALGWDIKNNSSNEERVITVATTPHKQIAKQEIIQFGRYKWRVLFVKSETALLLADEITDIGIPYNKEFGDVSWEESTLRVWLNTEFLKRFSPAQQKRIVTHQIRAESNPWYDTDAGITVYDKVFLLSITEVVRNLGNSGQLRSRPKHLSENETGQDGLFCAIDDKYNGTRIATYKDEATWWWLRSPGDSKSKAAYVNADGVIFLNGELVADDGGTSCVGVRPGVRPAIWIQQ